MHAQYTIILRKIYIRVKKLPTKHYLIYDHVMMNESVINIALIQFQKTRNIFLHLLK